MDLGNGEGMIFDFIKTLEDNIEENNKLKIDFKEYQKYFVKKMNELMTLRNKIRRIGETTRNRELKGKYEEFRKKEKRIKELKQTQADIDYQIREIQEEIENLRKQLKKDKEQKKEIEQIEKKKMQTQILLGITKNTRRKFLFNLLNNVNKTASEFLRSTVRDTHRFHFIEIDSDYQLIVKQRDGESLPDSQINRGNLQISMMSFFFGLSQFLEKEIPYVIDDPFLRLDPGHDKRLIEQLSKTNEQLVFHMIPGKEYTTHSFDWLSPHINIQNWLFIKEYKNIEPISYVERKDAYKIVKFDISKF